MVLVIKHLLKVHNLNDPYSGGISSYALTLMIVAFLQFQKMYCNPMHCMENYRTYEQKHEDLGYTIAQFFHFYYHTVSKFEDYRIHPHHPDDKFNQQPTIYGRTPFSSNNEDKLEIIDPLNPKNNVGKSSFNIDEIKECFKES